ncbi:hypothetical protein DET61_10930 [Marinobacter nauticus]|mgnify:FL=1|jgi:hypothetical protein|uniref:Transposase n=1 Tax=Marinobacter nauticus TaxID=2743 RepID=A0A368XGJ8_MARNT|nr:hypothetical protein DET61_10930 [Marinobacter nauticus]
MSNQRYPAEFKNDAVWNSVRANQHAVHRKIDHKQT